VISFYLSGFYPIYPRFGLPRFNPISTPTRAVTLTWHCHRSTKAILSRGGVGMWITRHVQQSQMKNKLIKKIK
jgi:hypothetical protein